MDVPNPFVNLPDELIENILRRISYEPELTSTNHVKCQYDDQTTTYYFDYDIQRPYLLKTYASLFNVMLVCKRFNSIINSNSFWLHKCIDDHVITSHQEQDILIKNDVRFDKLYRFNPFHRGFNCIKNSCGELGTIAFWDQNIDEPEPCSPETASENNEPTSLTSESHEENNDDSWESDNDDDFDYERMQRNSLPVKVEREPGGCQRLYDKYHRLCSCFITSYYWGQLSQKILFREHQYLYNNIKPTIEFSFCFAPRRDCASKCMVRIRFYDRNNELKHEWRYKNSWPAGIHWTRVCYYYRKYNAFPKYATVSIRGKDVKLIKNLEDFDKFCLLAEKCLRRKYQYSEMTRTSATRSKIILYNNHQREREYKSDADFNRLATGIQKSYIDGKLADAHKISHIQWLFEQAIKENDPRDVVKAYTAETDFYVRLNTDLAMMEKYWSGDKHERHVASIFTFHPAFEPYRFTGGTYHGVKISDSGLKPYIVGSEFMNKTFFSTSKERSNAEKFMNDLNPRQP
ncbi:unnamed protein product [Didymodactylos carnosus]|uniref:F-box domain-containing protein n=1 Tax=Didymodactylos carnosus TaxID=1234261 RepID=A0A815P8Y7_9BILA|nr:unnamed protein product [Didymodactylos carnosus]CAF1445745.1 unnamed protein product [Didymodactylos carnosus]CAF4148884.1 unnamed protein product [Didymodactylos carnosus]CAF4320522.1 unnamed protein product [Didymodactylos carnosus]